MYALTVQCMLSVSRLLNFLRNYKDVHNINCTVTTCLGYYMLNHCPLNKGIVFFIIYCPQQALWVAELS